MQEIVDGYFRKFTFQVLGGIGASLANQATLLIGLATTCSLEDSDDGHRYVARREEERDCRDNERRYGGCEAAETLCQFCEPSDVLSNACKSYPLLL